MANRRPPSLMVACLLPWTPAWQLDERSFAKHIDDTLELGFKSLYILGTAGEGYALSESLYRQVVSVFADRTLGKACRPQVGVIGTSMAQMIDRIGFAHRLGFRDFQVSLPCWGALSETETLCFFETVCGEFADSSFLHYNLSRAKRLICGDEYRRIADRVPNLTATKNNCSRERTQELLTKAPDLQHFLLEANYCHGCALGPCSLLSSLGLLFPKLAHQLFGAGSAGNQQIVAQISQFMNTFIEQLLSKCRRTLVDGAYDKTFLWLRNPEFLPHLLPPYQGLTPAEMTACRNFYEARYQQADNASMWIRKNG